MDAGFLPEGISIHALHEESDRHATAVDRRRRAISIHALHEESDVLAWPARVHRSISIHALHEESDRSTG